MDRRRAIRLGVGALFPLFFAGVLVIAVVYRREIVDFFMSTRDIEAWVQGFGFWAPLAFVAVQAFQVIIFVVPGEVVQIAGGYLFGIPLGTAWSLVGIALGTAVSFYIARALGRRFVESVVSPERVAWFDGIARSRRAQGGFLLLFLIPGMPKDVLVHVAGISKARFFAFLLASMAGRLPGIVGSVVIGESASEGDYVVAGVILGVGAVLFVAGLLLRKRVRAWLGRRMERG
jgi:uncharacterized membrane protein YdjX (TVP38/TMEM64 family)